MTTCWPPQILSSTAWSCLRLPDVAEELQCFCHLPFARIQLQLKVPFGFHQLPTWVFLRLGGDVLSFVHYVHDHGVTSSFLWTYLWTAYELLVPGLSENHRKQRVSSALCSIDLSNIIESPSLLLQNHFAIVYFCVVPYLVSDTKLLENFQKRPTHIAFCSLSGSPPLKLRHQVENL